MTIEKINIGGAPNDGTGQPLRSGGQVINDNFAELDVRAKAAQSKADEASAAALAAQVKADAALPATAAGVSVAQLVAGKVPAEQLPDSKDVLEFANRVAFPAVGEVGKIYLAVNGGDSASDPTRQYRWNGSVYLLIPSVPASTDQVAEGAINKYWTAARTLAVNLPGLSFASQLVIEAGDNILTALGKLQSQLSVKLGRSETAADSSKLGGQPASFYTTVMTGATSSGSGTQGLVPAPRAGEQDKVLSGAGTYIDAGGAGLPVGAVIPWTLPEDTIPAGMIPRNGQLLSRATWPQLWILVSAAAVTDAQWVSNIALRGCYSSGDGSTTFRMPDDNGKYSDGLGVGAVTYRGYGKNSTGTVGLHQADQLQGTNLGTGAFRLNAYNTNYPSAGGTAAYRKGAYFVSRPTGDPADLDLFAVTDGVNGTPRVGAETRMANSTVIWVTVGATKASNPGTVDVTALATNVATLSSRISGLDARVYKFETEILWTGSVGSASTIQLSRTLEKDDVIFFDHNDGSQYPSNSQVIYSLSAGKTYSFNFGTGGATAATLNADFSKLNLTYFTSGYGVRNVYAFKVVRK
ncbi:phage tail protein [Pseudomonas gingeri]|uniref:phage tail protein n=1 Tax=Pseudomonas gingeri TaxID=117681 RepID=UPI0015A35A88|nr:phage tail protein [Pseudomonas gingeri]NWE49448.1 hypothetical protein [Pseudomonas gingeri]